MPVEVIDADVPEPRPSLQGSIVVALGLVSEQSECVCPALGLLDRCASVGFGEWRLPGHELEHMSHQLRTESPCKRRLTRLGSPDSNRELTAPKAGGLPITPLPRVLGWGPRTS